MKTWYQGIQVIVMWARGVYVLGTDWNRFEMVGIRGITIYPSDHFTLQAIIRIFPPQAGHQHIADSLPSKIVTVYRGRANPGN